MPGYMELCIYTYIYYRYAMIYILYNICMYIYTHLNRDFLRPRIDLDNLSDILDLLNPVKAMQRKPFSWVQRHQRGKTILANRPEVYSHTHTNTHTLVRGFIRGKSYLSCSQHFFRIRDGMNTSYRWIGYMLFVVQP